MFPVLDNQPTLFDSLDPLDRAGVPVTAWSADDDRGRHELRTIRVLPTPLDLTFPHVAQVFLISSRIRNGNAT